MNSERTSALPTREVQRPWILDLAGTIRRSLSEALTYGSEATAAPDRELRSTRTGIGIALDPITDVNALSLILCPSTAAERG
jgi:hypothetical protein